MAIAASRPTPSTTAIQARRPARAVSGALGRQEGTEQAGRRDPAGPGQRQPGENRRHQESEQDGQDHGLAIEAGRRLPAEAVAQGPDHRGRGAGPDQDPDGDADQRDRGDLDQIDLEDLAPGRAEALHLRVAMVASLPSR
jgi:hypothetical protein